MLTSWILSILSHPILLFNHLTSTRTLEHPVLYSKLHKGRQEISKQVTEGTCISLVAEWTSTTLPPPSSLSSPSTPLRLIGHCDIGLPRDYSYLNLTPHASSPTITLQEAPNTLEVYSLYVHPSMHRTGCAQRLFACAARAGLRGLAHAYHMMTVPQVHHHSSDPLEIFVSNFWLFENSKIGAASNSRISRFWRLNT